MCDFRVKQIQTELGTQIITDFEEAFQGAGAKVCMKCSKFPLLLSLYVCVHLSFGNCVVACGHCLVTLSLTVRKH